MPDTLEAPAKFDDTAQHTKAPGKTDGAEPLFCEVANMVARINAGLERLSALPNTAQRELLKGYWTLRNDLDDAAGQFECMLEDAPELTRKLADRSPVCGRQGRE